MKPTIQQLYTSRAYATSFGHALLHPLTMLGIVEPYGGPCRRYCDRFTPRKWRVSMRVRNIAVGAGLAPWLSDRLDSICRAGFEEDPSSNSCKRFFSHLMSSLCFACSFAFAFGFSSMISHSCEYFSKRVCKPSKRCPCSSRLEQVNWASCCSDVCKVAEPGII